MAFSPQSYCENEMIQYIEQSPHHVCTVTLSTRHHNSSYLIIIALDLQEGRSLTAIFQATILMSDTSHIVKKCFFLNQYKNNLTKNIKSNRKDNTYVILPSETESSRIKEQVILDKEREKQICILTQPNGAFFFMQVFIFLSYILRQNSSSQRNHKVREDKRLPWEIIECCSRLKSHDSGIATRLWA